MILVDVKCKSCGHVDKDVLLRKFDDVETCTSCGGESVKMFGLPVRRGSRITDDWAVATTTKGDVIWEKRIDKPYTPPKTETEG
jgi:hypothetical protein